MNRKQIVSLIMGAASISFLMSEAFARETVSQQEPLFYEYNLKGPAVVESDVIVATGTITSIIGYWQSEGEVKLEASANAGIAYTPIINGQSLREGYIAGNQLRFRVKIGENSFLRNLMLGYEDSSGVSRHYHNQDLLRFKYSKVIYLSGGNEELFNYPIKLKLISRRSPLAVLKTDVILENEAKPDFQDIRFTAADSQIPLPYYVENVIAGSCAEVWVKVPQIPAGGTRIYVYYGSKDALTLSNPEGVFSFFDDFSGDKLDEKKWQVRPEFEKRLEINNGYLGLKGCSITSRVFRIKKGVLEFKAKSEPNAAIQAIAKGLINKQFGVASEQMVYSSAYPGAEHTIAINDVAKLNIGKPIEPMKDYIYRAIVNNEGIAFERYSENYEKQAEIKFLDTYQVNEGYIGLKAASSPLEGGSVYFDWVRVRPYTEVEPKAVEKRISE